MKSLALTNVLSVAHGGLIALELPELPELLELLELPELLELEVELEVWEISLIQFSCSSKILEMCVLV